MALYVYNTKRTQVRALRAAGKTLEEICEEAGVTYLVAKQMSDGVSFPKATAATALARKKAAFKARLTNRMR